MSTTRPKEPIKVAYLIDFFGAGGGTENQLAILINNLDRSRIEPHLYTLRTVPLDNPLEITCPLTHLSVSRLASPGAIRALWQFVSELRSKRIDILQMFFIDSNLFGVPAARLAGVRTLVVSRRDMGWWYESRAHGWTNRLNRRVHYCIANADAIRQVVAREEPFPLDRIAVVYNGVEPPESDYRENLLAALGIPPGVPIVLIVANLKAIKRVDRFIEMAAAMRRTDVHFLIVGYGNLKQNLIDRATTLGIGDRVHFYYTADHVFSVMKLATIGVLTSESEGLSNVLIEYAYSGLPAVAFDVGGNREAIVDGTTGVLIPPYDIAEMARAVDALVDDTERRTRMGEQARDSASRRFSISRMVEDTQTLYETWHARSMTE